MNFKPESGFDAALNEIENMGLPIRDRGQSAPQTTPSLPRPFQYVQRDLPPPLPSGLLPSPEFSYRPNTSNGFEQQPSSSSPERLEYRPWTAPTPASYYNPLPPRRELPHGMRINESIASTSSVFEDGPSSSAPAMSALSRSTHSALADGTVGQMLPPKRGPYSLQTRPIAPLSDPQGTNASALLSSYAKLPNNDEAYPASQVLPDNAPPYNMTAKGTTKAIPCENRGTGFSPSEQDQSTFKPPAKRKVQAKTSKPKADKQAAANKFKELQLVDSNVPVIHVDQSSKPIPQEVMTSKKSRKKTASQVQKANSETSTTTSKSEKQNTESAEKIEDAASRGADGSLAHPVEIDLDNQSDTTTIDTHKESPRISTVGTTSPTKFRDQRTPLVLRPGRKAMAEIAGNQKDLPSAAKVNEEMRDSLDGTGQVSAEEFMTQLDTFVREYQDLPAPKPRRTQAEELAEYAAQPDEVRQAVIKDMICDFLGDENFVRLVEDVSQEWRRIGLGF